MEYSLKSNYSTDESVTGNSTRDGVKVFNIIVNFFVLFVGVPGNCLIIRVYWAKTIKKSTYVLITSLAWADLFASILSVPVIVSNFLKLACFETNSWFHFIVLLRKIIVTSSVLLTGVIAVDRYDCVCRPQKRFFNLRRAKIAAWASFVFAMMWNLPLIISLYYKTSMIRVYISPILQIVCFLTSLLTIMFCYGNVYRVIQKHARASQSLDGAKSSTPGSSSIKKDSCVDSNDNVGFSHRHHAVELNTPRSIDSSSQELQPEQFQEQRPTSKEKADSQPATTSEKGEDKGSNKSKLYLTLGRSNSSHSVALQRKTTKMLFLTSLVFLLTWLPFCIRNAVCLAYSGCSNVSPEVIVVMDAISVIFFLNNAVNPFIYGIANRRFRKDCRHELQKVKPC